MTVHKWLVALFLLCVTGAVGATDAVPIDALRGKFPQGIPWSVEIINPDGKSRGELQMLITSRDARSCMGEVGEGFRVDFIRRGVLSPPLFIA